VKGADFVFIDFLIAFHFIVRNDYFIPERNLFAGIGRKILLRPDFRCLSIRGQADACILAGRLNNQQTRQ
jgi:hypothetical protein